MSSHYWVSNVYFISFKMWFQYQHLSIMTEAHSHVTNISWMNKTKLDFSQNLIIQFSKHWSNCSIFYFPLFCISVIRSLLHVAEFRRIASHNMLRFFLLSHISDNPDSSSHSFYVYYCVSPEKPSRLETFTSVFWNICSSQPNMRNTLTLPQNSHNLSRYALDGIT